MPFYVSLFQFTFPRSFVSSLTYALPYSTYFQILIFKKTIHNRNNHPSQSLFRQTKVGYLATYLTLLTSYPILKNRIVLIKMSVRTVPKGNGRFVSRGKETLVSGQRKRGKTALYVLDAVGGQQVEKRLTPFSSSTVISISMWICTLAHTRSMHDAGPRASQEFMVAVERARFINTLRLH